MNKRDKLKEIVTHPIKFIKNRGKIVPELTEQQQKRQQVIHELQKLRNFLELIQKNMNRSQRRQFFTAIVKSDRVPLALIDQQVARLASANRAEQNQGVHPEFPTNKIPNSVRPSKSRTDSNTAKRTL